MACAAYVDGGQTNQFCKVRWLLLANSRLNEISVGPVPCSKRIDLDSLRGSCRKAGCTPGAGIGGGVASVAERVLGGKFFAPIGNGLRIKALPSILTCQY